MLSKEEQVSPQTSKAIVAWQCALVPRAHTYAAMIRKLGILAVASTKKGKLSPASSVFAFMVSLNGDWKRADPKTRKSLKRAYDGLNLKLASAAMPSPDDTFVSEKDGVKNYVAPGDHVYGLDEDYDRGIEAAERGDWQHALILFERAYKGYWKEGGLYELHAADSLMNMSAAAVLLGNLEQGSENALSAQLLYERWAQLKETAKALLNRAGILYEQGRFDEARRLALECERFALKSSDAPLAADARCAGTVADSMIHPNPACMTEMERISKFYGKNCSVERSAAYERCQEIVRKEVDHAVARQSITLILRRAAEHGIPDNFEPLKKLVQRCPRAVFALTDSSFLELSSASWPVLLKAARHARIWTETGAVEFEDAREAKSLCDRLDLLERFLRVWMNGKAPSEMDLEEYRPSLLLESHPRKMSEDAASVLLSLQVRWIETWSDDPDELEALGALCILGGVTLALANRHENAMLLFQSAFDCRPDVIKFFAGYLREGSDSKMTTILKLMLNAVPSPLFPDEPRLWKAVSMFLMRQIEADRERSD